MRPGRRAPPPEPDEGMHEDQRVRFGRTLPCGPRGGPGACCWVADVMRAGTMANLLPRRRNAPSRGLPTLQHQPHLNHWVVEGDRPSPHGASQTVSIRACVLLSARMPRERAVLRRGHIGPPSSQIADSRGVTHKTREDHSYSSYLKLGLQNQSEALSVALHRRRRDSGSAPIHPLLPGLPSSA